MPPNGSSALGVAGWLIHSMPTSTRFISRCAFLIELVKA
jgi:hypothetical protein